MGILDGKTHRRKSVVCSEKVERYGLYRVWDVYLGVTGRLDVGFQWPAKFRLSIRQSEVMIGFHTERGWGDCLLKRSLWGRFGRWTRDGRWEISKESLVYLSCSGKSCEVRA